MKPIRLEIEGLNSFCERQSIDFTAVLQEGIFGIFGNTGSGKSTILDAIALALYSRTQKNNKKDEYVNCKSKKAAVSFTFEILCEGRRRTFEFVREIFPGKRAGNAFAYEFEGDKKFLLEDKSDNVTKLAEKIVGLGYDDFNKCIALPQGEFARFTKSTGAERLDIVARLFSLEKYGSDLYAKASARANGYESELSNLRSEMSAYAEYGEEQAARLKERIAAGERAEGELSERLKAAETALAEKREVVLLRRELRETEEKLNELALKEKEIAEMKKRLDLSADIDRFCEAQTALSQAEKALAESERGERDCVARLSALKEREKRFAEDGFETEAQKKTEALAERRALLNKLGEELKETAQTEAQLLKVRAEYRAEEAERKKLEALAAAAEERLTANGELLALLGEERDLFKEITESAGKKSVREEYVFLQGEYEKNDSRELWLKRIIEEKLGGETSEEIDLGGLERLIGEEKRKNAERKRAAEAKLRLTAERGDALSRLEVQKNKLEVLLARGSELKELLEKKRAETERVTGGEDWKTLAARTERELSELQKKREERRAEEAGLREETQAVAARLAGARAEIENLKKKISENAEKSKEILIKCGIMEKDTAFSMRMSEERKKSVRAELESYERDSAVFAAKKRETEHKLGGREATEEELTLAERTVAQVRAELDAAGKTLSEDRLLFRINEEKRGVKAELEKKEKALEKKYEVAKLLQNLVKKRAFLDYVANEYLEDVTRSASATLLKLTSGGYGLAYDGEFFVTDNKNGGALRSVNTLSGGETFLVSLSLAFSLSTYICAKSDRPIEFFFLDEGFGTLDSELVETVLDSLEKFKSEKFSIGIISHVRELKERINCKVLVTPATESAGSQIEITY